jgi:glycosyltransferase involved in cell wall biosynthesis
MKVLFIATLPPPVTGQSVAGQVLLDQLKDDGHTVCTINLSKNTFRQGISSLSRIFEVLGLTWRTWKAGRHFDAVYLTTSESLAGNLKDMLLLVAIGRLRSITWLHLHGGAGMRKLLAIRTGWIGRLNHFFLKRVAGVIVLGERLTSIFDGYVEAERIRVVKNFAADNLFLDECLIADKWSDNSVLRVLFLSNLLEGKGHLELLKAIRKLSPEIRSRFCFDFAGGFESVVDEALFRAEIADLPNVTYHGVVHGDAKQALLAKAHVFCLPTFYPYEGQPISILEAYASGCVVLTTDHSGIFDIFMPGKNGWEVQPRCPESIVAALEDLAVATVDARKIAYQNRKEADLLYTKQAHLRALYAGLGWGRPT